MEVLVAVAIMGIAFTSILHLYSQSVAGALHSRFYIQAPLLAEAAIARWEIGMSKNGDPLEPQWDEGESGFSVEIETSPLDVGGLGNSPKTIPRLTLLTCRVSHHADALVYTTESLKYLAP